MKNNLAAKFGGGLPQFKHDGDTCCTFLGFFDGSDLYYCSQHGFPTVIARDSGNGGDYASGMNSKMPKLVEAQRRAAVCNLPITPEEYKKSIATVSEKLVDGLIELVRDAEGEADYGNEASSVAEDRVDRARIELLDYITRLEKAAGLVLSP